MSCKNCRKRHAGCHATCEEYLEEKKKRDDLKEIIRKERAKEENIIYQEVKRTDRLKKGVKHGR